jgi:hypothetical protein
MTCYEVLVGCTTFEDLVRTCEDYEAVIRGEHSLLANYIDYDIQELVTRCWDSNLAKKHAFYNIISKMDDIIEIQNFGRNSFFHYYSLYQSINLILAHNKVDSTKFMELIDLTQQSTPIFM